MNVRGVKNKRKKQTTKPDNPAQSAKFIESAKSLGLGGDSNAFERAMDKLVPPKRDVKK